MSLTYTTLKAAIQAWVENDATEFTDQLDLIISLAELRIYREADLDEFRKFSTTTIPVGARFLSKPTDMVIDRWVKVKNAAGEYQDVRRKDTSFIEEIFPEQVNPAHWDDYPRYYSDWDDDWFILAPYNDTARTLQLAYTYRPTGLTSSNATSWLGTNASDILLWACVVEAMAFMKEMPADIEYWNGRYTIAMKALQLEEMKRNRKDEARHGEPRGEN